MAATNSNDLAWAAKFAPPPPNPNGPLWWTEFTPKVSAPSDPQTIPITIPKTTKGPVMQTENAILLYNNTVAQFIDGKTTVWSNTEEGVTIHKITMDEAAAISTRIKPAAYEYKLPLTYVLACLAIESVLDPGCVNENIGTTSAGVARSNPTNDPGDYDLGIAQLKSKYLVGVAHGVTTVEEAAAFSYDVDTAIPYHCSLMATKFLWAMNLIQENTVARHNTQAQLQVLQTQLNELHTEFGGNPTADQQAQIASCAAAVQAAQDEYDTACKPDHRLSNPYLLATGAYNFGDTGMTAYYTTGQFPSHCQHVIDLEAYFAKQLGVTSIFAGLS